MSDPPVDVALEMADGSSVPVSCVFVRVEDGIAMWEVVDAPEGRPVNIRVGVLPARTGIRLPLGGLADGHAEWLPEES